MPKGHEIPVANKSSLHRAARKLRRLITKTDSGGAFGAPGAKATWTRSSKEAVGTAYHTSCQVWYTIAEGIINEVYYPHVDRPNTRDLQLLITDGETFVHEEPRDLDHQVEYPEPNALLVRLTNSDRAGRYRIVKEVLCDPHHSVLLMHTRIDIEGVAGYCLSTLSAFQRLAADESAATTAAPLAHTQGAASPSCGRLFCEAGLMAAARHHMKNPIKQYPKPPFPHQPQKPPGLASKMKPRPDHGEKSYKGTGRLKGRKALVTGGDSGIGRAAAIAFAREGADVAICYLPEEESDAAEVIKLIKAAGRKAIALPGDIREESFCEKLVADAVKGLGGLDILVNNAGKQQAVDSILDLTTEEFDATFKTNVYALFWITKAAIPHLKPGSTIINTSSVQAYDPSPNLVDYAQTKSCIVSFTKSLAQQIAEKGIRVNAVAPGPYWTPLQSSGGQPPKKVQKFGEETAMGRPGQPVELAPVYVLLASEESSYATGQVYGASGGGGNP